LSQNATLDEHLSLSKQLSTPLKLTETGIRIKPTLAFEHFSLEAKRSGLLLMPVLEASFWRHFLNRAWLDAQPPFLL